MSAITLERLLTQLQKMEPTIYEQFADN